MKTLFTLLITIVVAMNCYSQFPSSYPNKSICDNDGNIYVAGEIYNDTSGRMDFFVKKIPREGATWIRQFPSLYGNGKAMNIDIVKYGDELNIFATGYVINQNMKSEILTVKINELGTPLWQKTFSSQGDCKGYGIAIDSNKKPCITGFITENNKSNILTLKYDDFTGDLIFQNIYYHPTNRVGADAGTTIMADLGHVYVMGYVYNGWENKSDIILLSFDTAGNFEKDIYESPNDQKPVSMAFTEKSKNAVSKSRLAITSTSDVLSNNTPFTEFLTMYYDGGIDSKLRWSRKFRRKSSLENVATSIDADIAGNVYVTGYTKSSVTGYDYTTIKYTDDGYMGWSDGAKYYDIDNGNDRASSIRLFENNIFVTGSSELSPGGYRTLMYEQNLTGTAELVWDNIFTPSYLINSKENLLAANNAATICIDQTSGVINVMTMNWGEGIRSKFALQGYNEEGQIVYTYENNDEDAAHSLSKDNISQLMTDDNYRYNLSQNYPNPFNPSTIINYTIPYEGIVRINVYDMAGKEIAILLNEYKSKGLHGIEFNSKNYPGLSSGMYFYKIESNGFTDIRKMILVK